MTFRKSNASRIAAASKNGINVNSGLEIGQSDEFKEVPPDDPACPHRGQATASSVCKATGQRGAGFQPADVGPVCNRPVVGQVGCQPDLQPARSTPAGWKPAPRLGSNRLTWAGTPFLSGARRSGILHRCASVALAFGSDVREVGTP